ncbi:MAG: twin-arginine translocase TatA/TatE family subunit [Alphaproteobacteria bacterium]
MGLSIWQILIIVAVVVLLFGAGKIPRLAKDLGSGVNAFKRGLKDSESRDSDASQRTIEASATPTATGAKDEAAKS